MRRTARKVPIGRLARTAHLKKSVTRREAGAVVGELVSGAGLGFRDLGNLGLEVGLGAGSREALGWRGW